MPSEILNISSGSISDAWIRAFSTLMIRGVTELTPLVVSVECAGGEPEPNDTLRSLLDAAVQQLKPKHQKLQPCNTVANTIFPVSLWNPDAENDAEQLFRRYSTAWPLIKRCSQNRRGSYFRRLTAFGPDGCPNPVNQLAHIIATYSGGNHRRSALQAAVFDPALDHVNSRQLGFPCLHQVAFAPVGENGLSVTGFYATQYVFDRAYGNYLGLCNLGKFMAKQLGLELSRMTCIAAVAKLGSPGKGELASLAKQMEPLEEVQVAS